MRYWSARSARSARPQRKQDSTSPPFVSSLPSTVMPLRILLMITDAAINVIPELDDKRDVVQNAIDLCQALGVERPKIAIMSAVEKVNSRLRSTIDAAALAGRYRRNRANVRGGRQQRRRPPARRCHTPRLARATARHCTMQTVKETWN
ncbi:MAG: phosphate acyltransferase [Pseudomonadota bacterium]